MDASKLKRNILLIGLLLCSCERLDNDPGKHIADADPAYVALQEVVEIMTLLPVTPLQLQEVHSAVSASSDNGYDEEYTMVNLFAVPGAGVGDPMMRSGARYDTPMRDLICSAVKDLASGNSGTKSSKTGLNVSRTVERLGVDAFLSYLLILCVLNFIKV